LSISEVAEATGLQSSALRYYEMSGLIASETRVGGRRHYAPGVLQRLAVIALLQEVGFTIAEMRELFARGGRSGRWRSLAEAKLRAIDAHLERVTAARALLASALDCGCSSLETCDLVSRRRGSHRQVVQTLTLKMGAPRS
ncbi:MAG: MerR family transcriptional regulator, partial [Actinomycetota bacterium]